MDKKARSHHPQHAHEAFTTEVLKRVAETIAEVETATNAEIRISIRDLRDGNEVGMPLEELARKEFAALGMHQTEGRTGILLLVMYDEKKFFVFADEGVHSKANPDTWNDVAQTLREHFGKGMFEEGLRQALHKIEHHVQGLLTKRSTESNELSNEVAIR